MITPQLAKVVAKKTGGFLLNDLFNSSKQFALPPKETLDEGTIVSYRVFSGSGESVEIDRIFAAANSARAAIYLSLSEYGLDPEFPAAVLNETQSIIATADFNDPDLLDLTHLPFITIDNVDSKDLDQAMHITGADDGGYLLHYALADAAHYIKPDSALFSEALQRGASYYVPGMSVPMLPRSLSEGLISLNEGALRRALVFNIEFSVDGDVRTTKVFQAYVKSAAKLSYSGVEAYYQNAVESVLASQPYTETLDLLRELGQLRIEESFNRNVVEYDRNGIEIDLNTDGKDFRITDSKRLNVERYNEQISLVCNSEGARLLEEVGMPSVVQAIYRIHDAPDEDRLKKFSRLLKGLIHQHQLQPSLWTWRWRDGKYGDKEHLSAFLQRLRTASVNQRLLSAVQRHALMLSPASRFSANAGAHHSLKLDQYARFSSPMREIAGIYTHRELLQYQRLTNQLNQNDPATGQFNDEALRTAVIDAANRSKEVQKRLNKAVMKKAIDQLFEPELERSLAVRNIFTGTVISVRSTRVYVRLDTPKIIVKVYLKELSRLTGVSYRLDKSSAYISNKESGSAAFVVGQALRLRTQDYSDDSGRWWLVPIESPEFEP